MVAEEGVVGCVESVSEGAWEVAGVSIAEGSGTGVGCAGGVLSAGEDPGSGVGSRGGGSGSSCAVSGSGGRFSLEGSSTGALGD